MSRSSAARPATLFVLEDAEAPLVGAVLEEAGALPVPPSDAPAWEPTDWPRRLGDAIQFLRRVNDRVRGLGLESLMRVDPAPRHRHGEHSRRLRRLDVERRVADVGGLLRRC